MQYQTRKMVVEATEIVRTMTMGEAESLGLKWDDNGLLCGRRGLYSSDGYGIHYPVPVGYFAVRYENGDIRIFPDAGFHEIFEPARPEGAVEGIIEDERGRLARIENSVT